MSNLIFFTEHFKTYENSRLIVKILDFSGFFSLYCQIPGYFKFPDLIGNPETLNEASKWYLDFTN